MPTADETHQPTVGPVILPPGSGRAIPLGDAGVVTLKAEHRQTGGTISAYKYTAAANAAGPPEHFHRGWDEVFYVLDGEITFLVDGVEHAAHAGSFVFVPRGVPHTFWNAGAVPARQLVVFHPGGIEDYFDAVTAVMAAGGDDAPGAAEALMAKHDMVVSVTDRPAYEALSRPVSS